MCFVTHTKKLKWKSSVNQEQKASTNTRRESGDWVALHNIINRGSTQRSYKKSPGIISWAQQISKVSR